MKLSLILTALLALNSLAQAGNVNMNEPKRAVGTEQLETDQYVRVDAQLRNDSVGSGSVIAVNYQIKNLTKVPIAIAEKVVEVSYDADTRTITLSVGAEIPKDGQLPHLTIIPSGQEKSFSTGGTFHLAVLNNRARTNPIPRYVQVKVNFLRDLTPVAPLIDEQAKSNAAIKLDDALFNKYLEANDTIFLNTLPVAWNPSAGGDMHGADYNPGVNTGGIATPQQ